MLARLYDTSKDRMARMRSSSDYSILLKILENSGKYLIVGDSRYHFHSYDMKMKRNRFHFWFYNMSSNGAD